MNSRVRNTLLAARERRGWTQTEAAEAAGVTRQSYAAIESGASVPSTEVALRLARAFSRAVEELFRLPEPPVEEVRARGAQTIGIATAGDERVAEVADETIEVAATDWILQPLVAILPRQLLAYDIATARGLNVDQPRNLAKSVTVE